MIVQEHFQFLSNNGKTKIHAVKWIPQDRKIRGILQLVHGMEEHIERYDEFARFMAGKGFLVTGHDHLGHGASIQSEADWGYFTRKKPSETAVADMYQLTRMMQREYPKLPYFILGHSMGSFLLRRYLILHSKAVTGAIICGTGTTPNAVTLAGMLICKTMALFKGDKYRSRFVTNASFGKAYAAYDMTGAHPEKSWLSRNVESVRAYYADPRCGFMFTLNGYFMLFSTLYYINQKKNLRKIRRDLPVFFIAGADDPVGESGKGVRQVCVQFRQAGIKDISLRLYGGDRHEILQETDRKKVFMDVYKWCRKHM